MGIDRSRGEGQVKAAFQAASHSVLMVPCLLRTMWGMWSGASWVRNRA